MRGFITLKESDAIHEQFKSFKLLSEIRLIFESNRLENAGTTYGETRKLINEFFPQIPSDYQSFRLMDPKSIQETIQGKKIKDFVAKMKAKGLSLEQIRPTIQFGNQSREFVEVAQHFIGYLHLEIEMQRFQYTYFAHQRAEAIKATFTEKKKKDWEELFSDLNFDTIQFPTAFSEALIKSTHVDIAKNLIPGDANVIAGEYRLDDRSAGLDTVFVSPKLIPDAMKGFIETSNALIGLVLNPIHEPQKMHPVEAAARISHQLVRIHPFPDFNGRMSRLISNYVLSISGMPFAVAVRGGARDKQRYITALKKADIGDYTYFESILAKSIIDCFLEIDSNLKVCNLSTMQEQALTFI